MTIVPERAPYDCLDLGGSLHFGMKAHIGVDNQTKLIHSVAAMAANVHDSQVLPQLLHGQEMRVWWGDAASSRQHAVIREHAPDAQSFIQENAPRHRPLSEAECKLPRQGDTSRGWHS